MTELVNFYQKIRAFKAENRKIISLGLGEPYFDPARELVDCLNKAVLEGNNRLV